MSQQISGGLKYIHGKRIIHRDLKPENFLILKGQKNKLTVKLTDFGLSKYYFRAEAYKGYKPGTPGYAPPEKQLTLPSDIYSLGVVLTELFFCENVRDLDVQLQGLKIKPCQKPTEDSPVLDRSDESIVFSFCIDDLVSKYKKIPAYEDFLRSLDRKSRHDIEACLTNVAVAKKPKIHVNMIRPLKIIPFELWIKQLLGDCLKKDPEDRPTIWKVQQSLNIAGCLQSKKNTNMSVIRWSQSF